MEKFDAVIIGSGPNGLAAGIKLAENDLKVLIIEAKETIGGGTRSGELTLPGFNHDYCSGVHPAGELSPFFKSLPLEKYGLEWLHPEFSVAHPLDGEPAVILKKSITETARDLGEDAVAWEKIFIPFVNNSEQLFKDTFGPLTIPENPLLLAKFGLKGVQSARSFAEKNFKGERAKALFAGCAGHSILPMEKTLSAAIGLMFVIQGHATNWPVVKGGSVNLTNALAGYFKDLGGEIRTSQKIQKFEELPEAKTYLFDTDPLQLATIAKNKLPENYIKRLQKYRFGPGVFKVDWALSESIPWHDPNCKKASTVHIGGTLDEISISESNMWNGIHNEKPYIILCQQSEIDKSRAPSGQHTGYAYCHVPNGSIRDMTEIIENQVERFAPGFKDIILKKHTTNTQQFQNYNANYYGGAITGGVADLQQIFTRPVARLDPYSTPNSKIFICSASTPPGGGVHGMCGYHAARSVLKKNF